MSELQLNNENIRINYHGRRNFFNVGVRDDWQATIWNLDEFNYWIVVRFIDGRYSPHQIVCVPSAEWLTDWKAENQGKFEIIYNPQAPRPTLPTAETETT